MSKQTSTTGGKQTKRGMPGLQIEVDAEALQRTIELIPVPDCPELNQARSLVGSILENIRALNDRVGTVGSYTVPTGGNVATISAYSLPDGSTVRKMRDQWIVERDSGAWLAKDHLGWEFPLQPSSRDEKFYARVSFATSEEAMDCWRKYERSVR